MGMSYLPMFHPFCVISGRIFVKYSTPQAAAYARDKMDGMEYLPGHRISVYYAKDLPSRQDSVYFVANWILMVQACRIIVTCMFMI
jgi:hypothetical protein